MNCAQLEMPGSKEKAFSVGNAGGVTDFADREIDGITKIGRD